MVMVDIYIKCGQYELAIDEVEELLSLETEYTPNDFKLKKNFDPIRENPRFQELMKKYAL